ncbi:Transcriptional coactivator HFI1/ADA1 [Spathaspora sp. JA1]|nr:Transcriptional coactivator HFI1/ADA1 [Spathaspora sp. JA1]
MTSEIATVTINPAVTTNNGKFEASNPSLSPTTNIATAPHPVLATPAASKGKSNKRLELERLIREFQTKLGNNWGKYHETLSLFLIGKLSRAELVSIITPLLKDGLLKYHNKLLLLNFANSLKDGPLDFSNEFASFWNKKAAKSTKVKSVQYEKIKQNIMGLPIRERRRIKNITRDSGKRGKLSAGITLTRHTLLPKIPMIQDKEQQQLQVNNLVQWQQDVVNGINTPIATENYEIPDYDNLSQRVLMTMREYGLTGGLNSGVLEVLLLGLETHLKNIVESAIDVAKYRKNKYTNNDYIPYEDKIEGETTQIIRKRTFNERDDQQSSKDITLCMEDMYDTLEMFPHLIEPSGPKYRLSSVMLENDDINTESLDYELPPRIELPPGIESPLQLSKPSIPEKTTSNGSNMNGSSSQDNEAKSPTNTSPVLQHSQPMPRPDAHVGTTDELKWLLHDLVSSM